MKILRQKAFTSSTTEKTLNLIKKMKQDQKVTRSWLDHAKQAENIRKSNPIGSVMHDIKRAGKQTMRQLEAKGITKEKLGKAAVRDAAIIGAAGLGYAAYKYNKNKKKEEK